MPPNHPGLRYFSLNRFSLAETREPPGHQAESVHQFGEGGCWSGECCAGVSGDLASIEAEARRSSGSPRVSGLVGDSLFAVSRPRPCGFPAAFCVHGTPSQGRSDLPARRRRPRRRNRTPTVDHGRTGVPAHAQRHGLATRPRPARGPSKIWGRPAVGRQTRVRGAGGGNRHGPEFTRTAPQPGPRPRSTRSARRKCQSAQPRCTRVWPPNLSL